ncbi:hypothetical protein BOTCAL_0266g00080 [Botryotinia calthae]|uniref:Uncharacterized protein n=1 Tax=Botryotinia calthae TaxID=38488 RepID=A0A4Y8CVX5_9HELO|nr:hypothetical protein BOTCAL_0266g00080 [Botryotinia calthae]
MADNENPVSSTMTASICFLMNKLAQGDTQTLVQRIREISLVKIIDAFGTSASKIIDVFGTSASKIIRAVRTFVSNIINTFTNSVSKFIQPKIAKYVCITLPVLLTIPIVGLFVLSKFTEVEVNEIPLTILHHYFMPLKTGVQPGQ